MIIPGTKAPELKIHTVSDEVWDIHDRDIEKYLMVVFYRGIHCPVCKSYLKELSSLSDKFNAQGVLQILAVSGDSEEKAYKAKDEWNLYNVEVGFDQSLDSMKQWKLFISESIKDNEPKFFGEPGLFLIDKDHNIFYSAVNSMPFGRPKMSEMLDAVKFINDNKYPARGTVAYEAIGESLDLENPDLRYQQSGAPIEPYPFSI